MSSPTQNPGPELLEERSIGGILVHILALFTGIIGAGLIYLFSSNAFTKANARNAFNWHLSFLILFIISIIIFVLGADELTVGGETTEWSLLPAPFDTIFGVAGTLLLVIAMIAWLLTIVFTVIATVKAITGTPWEYPLARDFID